MFSSLFPQFPLILPAAFFSSTCKEGPDPVSGESKTKALSYKNHVLMPIFFPLTCLPIPSLILEVQVLETLREINPSLKNLLFHHTSVLWCCKIWPETSSSPGLASGKPGQSWGGMELPSKQGFVYLWKPCTMLPSKGKKCGGN